MGAVGRAKGRSATPARRLFLALASLALALLLFKPLCDVHTAFAASAQSHAASAHAHHAPGNVETCCSKATPGIFAARADIALLGWPGGMHAPLVAAGLLFVVVISLARRGPAFSSRPPPSPRSYYARSARILR